MNDFEKQAYYQRVLEATFEKQADGWLGTVGGIAKNFFSGGARDLGRAAHAIFGQQKPGQSALYNMLKGVGTAARGVGRMAVPVAGAAALGYGLMGAGKLLGKGFDGINNGVRNYNERKDAIRYGNEQYAGEQAELNRKKRTAAIERYKYRANESGDRVKQEHVDTWNDLF